MTREQIAQWRELMRRTADEGGVQVIVPNGVLSRLLDEREALLEALRHVEWGGDSFQGFAAVCPDCVAHEGRPHEPDCVLAAALAKAELP